MKQNNPVCDSRPVVIDNRGAESGREARSTASGELRLSSENVWRVYVLAYNRLLRETLGKLLAKRSELQVVGQSAATVEIALGSLVVIARR